MLGRDPAGEVEILGQRRRPPAADRFEQVTPDRDPVAAELGAAAHRPAAALQLPVEGLLVGLELASAETIRIQDPAPRRDRRRAGRDVAGQHAQEAWPDPGVRVEHRR